MFGFLAQLLAWCFDVVPSYGVAILLFTLIVMAAVTPFTVKGMRSAAEMARIQPEMKKLQDQYKNDRVKQNEEMQKLFKEHGVNPLGGCLPNLLPLPIFFVIFRLLDHLNGRHNGLFAPLVRLLRHQVGGVPGYVTPHYLSYNSSLTQHIIHSNGVMKSFGFDLASTARAHHATVAQALPYYGLIVVMTVSQYWQQRQINQRNPAAANANPQMKMTMQIFPAFYALISLSIPASVVLYLLLSGLYRMAQNSISYRFDPMLRASIPAVIDVPSKPAAKGLGRGEPAEPAAARRGFFASLREAADQARTPQPQGNGRTSPNGSGKNGRAQPAGKRKQGRAQPPARSGGGPRSTPPPAKTPDPAKASDPVPAPSPPPASDPSPAPSPPAAPASQPAAAPPILPSADAPPSPEAAPAPITEVRPAVDASASPLSVRPSGQGSSGAAPSSAAPSGNAPSGPGPRGRKRSKRRG
ncbi:MAG: YidC/Oxa1 family membrane protein insertase [Acidimicrobiales bacterium]